MSVTPTFRILANQADITATIKQRFISLTLTDQTGITSDTLEIVLSDHDPKMPIQKPPKGAELELFLGYDGLAERMGMFVCDEIEYTGWPGEMTIRARAAVFDKTPAGKANLQSQKTRSWPVNTTIGAMVAKVAKEHGMEPAVSASLKSIKLPHTDQQDESDLNLLLRIGKKYDAIVKPADGKLVMAKRGEAKSVGGKDLPSIALTPASGITRFRVMETARETSGTVIAYYHATKQAKRHEVKVGEGEPVTRIKAYQPTKEMALALAKSELAKRDRQKSTMSLAMPGRTDIAAECPLTLSGFRDGVDGKWIITAVVHDLTKDGGYQITVDGETPTDGDAAKTAQPAVALARSPVAAIVSPAEPAIDQARAAKEKRIAELTAKAVAKNSEVTALIAEGQAARNAGFEAKAQEIFGRASIINKQSGVMIAEAEALKATL